jgi:D-cysteine desulfhydrase family pyridoxal phosphate-dependent enzyme
MISLEALKDRLADFQRTPLILSPTPLQKIERPATAPVGVHLFMKRDDLTGLAFGGNKGRKLEYIVADAVAQGADTIVTWGGMQSNWCLQTAAAAARAGIRAVLVLLDKSGAPASDDGNLLLDHLCGATVRVIEVDPNRGFLNLEDVADLIVPIIEQEKATGRKPYLAPIGGSVVEGSMKRPLGAMGYANALVEIVEQMRSRDLHIDTVVHASGSAGTQAGLVAAAKAVAPNLRIVGISVASDRDTLRGKVRIIAEQLLETLTVDTEIEDDDVIVFDQYVDPGYGILTPVISRAIATLAQSEGVVLDPVYTGKAWLGFMDLMKTGFVSQNENVVFIHTGGTPALFPYRNQMMGFLTG